MSSQRSGPLKGRVRVPGDKSISHRSLILSGMASGISRISGLLEGDDVLATAAVMQALGAEVSRDGDDWVVTGCGTGGLSAPSAPLDFGNSGTGVRLMMGVIAGHAMTAELVGDASLSKRPMGRVLRPLAEMGAHAEPLGEQGERLPLRLTGSDALTPITYELPVASAQVKSAILLAGLLTRGTTTVIEPKATRDHTEKMLAYFGAEIDVADLETGGRHISVTGGRQLAGADILVPGDPSSATFVVAAALIVPGSEVVVENVLLNPTRTGVFDTLVEMGAQVSIQNRRESGGEETGDLHVAHSSLRGVTVPAERAPSMIDEYPVLAAIAPYADGPTVMEGLEELRVKESDRLASTFDGLKVVGADARVEGDTLIVEGRGQLAGGGPVATHLDHRMAMAFLTAGLAADGPVGVDDGTMIATSFPSFVELMRGLGGKVGEDVTGTGDE